ncbi:LuxR C-terminal-related transcriptional regulator [Actinophytocola sp.]|uniref:LuxR C-terminal-related transcriptional regulator n=1 Tax=Actinophytocola sp. TaxID=1872138 RepID=UPI002ED28CAD
MAGGVVVGADLPHLGPAAALTVLREAAAAARGGHSRAVFVSGVAGTGKSSLLASARAELAGPEGAVLFGNGRRQPLRKWFGPLRGDDHAVVHGLWRRVSAMLAEGPLTIVLDDAHAADPLVLRCVDCLLHRTAGQPLLMVVAYDSDAAHPVLTTVTGLSAGIAIELGPLSPDEITELVTVALGDVPEPPFLRACARLSGGHPLSLRTLLDGLRAHGVRPDGDQAERAAEIGERVLAAALPARLDRLPGDARRVATAVALVGATEPQLIATLLEVPPAAVSAGMDALRRHGLLLADQPTVDRAVLGTLAPAELDALRRRAARLLHDEGRPPVRVARLLVELPDLDEPWMYYALWDAAVYARRHGDPEAGASFLDRALAALSGHTETLVELAGVMSDIDPEAAAAYLGRAIEATSDPRTRALLADRLGVLALRTQRVGGAFPLLCDVLDTLDERLDAEARARLESVILGIGLHSASTVPEVLDRARAMRVPAGDTPVERLALGMLAITAMVDGGSATQAAERARAASAGAVVLHNGPVIVAARILDRAGVPTEALSVLDGVSATIRRSETGRTYCHVLAARSVIAAGMGRCAEAAADAENAMRICRDRGWAAPRLAFASALLERGEHARAEMVLNGIHEPTFVWEHHGLLMARAQARFLKGDQDGALSLVLRCGRSLEEAGIRSPMLAQWWLLAAVVLAEQGRHAEARTLVEAQTEPLTRWGTAEALGLGQLAMGIATQEVDLMVAAVDRLAESPARLSELRAGLHVGAALLRAGDDAGARKHLRRVVDVATRCGHRVIRSTATGLLMAAGGRIRKPSAEVPGPLTAAERRVADHASAGATNREISRELYISVRTVETHLSRAYRKLGVSSRDELARALREIATPGSAAAPPATLCPITAGKRGDDGRP